MKLNMKNKDLKKVKRTSSPKKRSSVKSQDHKDYPSSAPPPGSLPPAQHRTSGVPPQPPRAPYPYPHPYPPYPPYSPYPVPYYYKPIITKKMSELSIILIFLVSITVFWLPYTISGFIGMPFNNVSVKLAEVIASIALCVLTLVLMLFIRQNLDKPTLKDYGISTENLSSNLILTMKLIFIFIALEFLAVTIFNYIGVSFEGGPQQIDIYFIFSAVIIAPIFEETVYRLNASTLLARRLPILWVAVITSTWFIAKHVPMWHFEDGFKIPAILVILMINIPTWMVVTYYFLKRNCIWIPFIVHFFNNGSIALFYYLPDQVGVYLEYILIGIGIVFIFIFGLPKINKVIIEKIRYGKFQLTKETYNHMAIAVGLIILFLITSEALVFIADYNLLLCMPIGLILIGLSIFTVLYILTNRNIVYMNVKD